MDRLGYADTNETETAARPRRHWLITAAVLISATLSGHAALAKTHHTHHLAGHHAARIHARHATHSVHAETRQVIRTTHHRVNQAEYSHVHLRYAEAHHRYHYGHVRYASARYRHSGLQCVPYARDVSHIELSGDAFLWWAEAAGRYARGNTPVEGAVLNFRAIGRMPLGHVAVVTSVIDSRTILTTQANWIRGTITNDVTMQDVSPNNDWTQVEVELGDSSRWGAPYPTYGFIYDQPDSGANLTVAADDANPGNEVAEAPRPVSVQTDAPDRALQ